MPRNAGLSTAEAKAKYLDCISTGLTVAQASAAVGRSAKTAANWRASDKEFASRVDDIRAKLQRARSAGRDEDLFQLDFAAWRKRFLGRDTYMHMQQWIDVLEGRELAEVHPAIYYRPGQSNRVIINTPPFMAKSTTVTQEYITYRLCMNPNLRVLIVSEDQGMASDFLYSIKRMLTSPFFAELQAAYGGDTGFQPRRGEGQWTTDRIYLATRGENAADPASKDPNVQALGVGSHIYGRRADLVVLDDAISLKNAHNYEKQTKWLLQEVISRAKNGKILLIGTRVASTDLYSHLSDDDNYATGPSPWTYLAQPMVLEFAEDPKDWVTLWPRSSQPADENQDHEPDADGTYRAWDGPESAKKRGELAVSPTTWALVYMQESVAEDATFNPLCVKGSTDARRKAGPLTIGAWGGRRGGMEGLHVIGSVDPAGTGEAFMVTYGVDRQTKERWLLNAWMHRGAANTQLYVRQMQSMTQEYRVNEWVIEQNAYGSWLVNDEEFVAFCRTRGIPIRPHYTGGQNKPDPDFGVASMAPLFGSLTTHVENGRSVFVPGSNLIHLPDPDHSGAIKQLVEQLITWQPGKLGRQLRQDGPMCIWFAELRAREILHSGAGAASMFMHNRYLSRGQRARQMVVPQDAYQAMVGADVD